VDRLEEIIKILKAISDESRVRILAILKEKQNLCVCEIREIIGLSQPAISSHLKILENAGLIYNFKDGKWVNYRLNSEIEIMVKELLDKILLIIKDSDQIISDKRKLEKVDRLKINYSFNFNLNTKERLELEIIVLDKDKKSSLTFIRKYGFILNEAESLEYCAEWLKKIKKGEQEKMKIKFTDKGPKINI